MQALDDLIARVERLMLLAALAMMTLLVGLDVTQRTFSRPIGRTEALVAALVDAVAGPLSESGRQSAQTAGTVVFAVVFAAMFCLAAHGGRVMQAERASASPPSVGGSVVRGLGAFIACAVGVKALLVVFPSSVPGAQKFALGFMLWAGMLGASLATRQRRHIVLDPIVKKLEGDDRKRFALIGNLVSALFCGGVFLLAVIQTGGEIHEWRTGDGVGLYPALPIPMWLSTLAIPTTFGVMTFRFLKNAWHDFQHGPPASVDAHSVDLTEVEKLAEGSEGAAS
jgi:C4-dicarboxylate transporter, DctQ subunit